MSISILMATPTLPFGDLIRSSLEESGRYRVQVIHAISEAQAALENEEFKIAILDSDLEGSGMRTLCEELNASRPELKLVLIPPENNPRHPAMDGLKCDAYLRKPFYLPDLLELMDEIVAGGFSARPAEKPNLNWLRSADLEVLIEASGARAALVMLQDGTAVFGGSLSEGLHDYLLELAGRFWQRPVQTDLLCFVRLEGEGQDSLLFLTGVKQPGEASLGLLYPGSTPLSKVRGQAGIFVRKLLDLETNPSSTVEAPLPEPDQAPANEPIVIPKDSFPEYPGEEDQPEEAVLRDFDLAALLGSIPSPDPNGILDTSGDESLGEDWMPELRAAFQPGKAATNGTGTSYAERLAGNGLEQPAVDAPVSGLGFDEPALDADAAIADEPSLSWVPETDETPAGLPPFHLEGFAGGEIEDDAIFNRPLPAQEDEERAELPREGLPLNSFDAEEQDETPLNRTSAAQKTPDLAAVEPQLAETPITGIEENPTAGLPAIHENPVDSGSASSPRLEPQTVALAGSAPNDYTCVLIPRLAQHYLAGELSERVSQWVQQVCQGLSWHLEGISVRPDYLLWTVQVAPTISPEIVVEAVRQRTSEYIFSQFERLRPENPGLDFWASGYLLVMGPQPPSAQLVREYIAKTRRLELVHASGGDPLSLAS